jgi:nickel transport protein
MVCRRNPGTLILLALSLAFLPALSFAHGVHPHVENQQAKSVAFSYENHQPMAQEQYDVFAPGSETPFQSGKTDLKGRAVFCPDQEGEWTVRVFTEDGHGATAHVMVDKAFLEGPTEHMEPHHSHEPAGRPFLAQKMITGIGVLLGIFGIGALIASRKN